jgi:hypothetical protein
MHVHPFLQTTVVALVLGVWTAAAHTEPYIGTEFPPNEVLLKMSFGFHALRNDTILGKIGQDNTFTVFVQDHHDNSVMAITLYRLDTNVWVYQSTHYDARTKRVVTVSKVLAK